MDVPEVEVLEITGLPTDNILAEKVKLGATKLSEWLTENMCNELIKKLRSTSTRKFLLTWQGGKVPRGVKIADYEIGWTQHGIVIDVNGKDIGTYERFLENGGETKEKQVMIIYFPPPLPTE